MGGAIQVRVPGSAQQNQAARDVADQAIFLGSFDLGSFDQCGVPVL